MGKEKARGHSAILLVIWSFPYLCLANTKFLWIVWQTPGGWMDLLSGTGVAPLKGMYNDPSPSLAGSTIAVRPVIPKNKGAKEDATLRMWIRWIIPVTGVSNLLEGGAEM